MKTVILVGGASASGKSTFVNELNLKMSNSIAYRRVQSFFDCAASKGIDSSETFKYIFSKDADDWFLNVCENNECVISDVHYALQMDRTFKKDHSKANIYQEYAPTISQYLINNLINSDIKIIAIHINCSCETLYNRAIYRNQNEKRELRFISIEDVKLQQLAERNSWQDICSNSEITCLELDSSIYSTEEMSSIFVDFFEINKEKIIKKRKI